MFRWHEPSCSKPFINVVGGLPWCETCCAVPPVNEDLDFPNDLDPPRAPPWKNGHTLAWPPGVKYENEDVGDKDEDLRIDHIDTDVPLQKASADGSNYLQAPLNGIKTAKHKSCYPSLPPRSIRILDITPGGPDDILHGNFRVVQLSKDSPHYEALSYTWADAAGNSQRCRAMYIGPFWDIVPITKNCDHALCSVRPRNDRLMQRTLWIDSVCVNQSDVIERTSQVALMPEIYSSAAEVLVYLGVATDSSNLALEAISRSLTTNDCSHSQEKSMCKICQSATFELFERPYFRRLWVVQEIILSRSITMFCGALSSSLPFSRMLELLPTDAWTIRRVKKPLNPKADLLSLMIETSNCACKDPRDKIFALLGIPTDWPGDPILPDYSLSVGEVAIGIASYFMQVCNLAWLVLMLAGLKRKNVEHLPSWVPDTETSFKIFGARKQLCDQFLRNSTKSNSDLFDQHDIVFKGKWVPDNKAQKITTGTADYTPLVFEHWTEKDVQITSAQGHLRVAASKLCKVREAFDMESVGCSRDFIRVKAAPEPPYLRVSRDTCFPPERTKPKLGLPYAPPLLYIPKPGNDLAFQNGWSDFILENNELYWLHGVQGFAILRPSPSCNMYTLISVCFLAINTLSGAGSRSCSLRPIAQTMKDVVRSELEALVPQTGDQQIHQTLQETNDEVAIIELGIRLSRLLPVPEDGLWDQWTAYRRQWYSGLANPDFLEHVISDLEESAKTALQDKEATQRGENTKHAAIKDYRSVAAVLWSILPEQTRPLSPFDKPATERDTTLTYHNLDEWAKLTTLLIKGTETQEFDGCSINYLTMPDGMQGPYHNKWHSSWENFRTRTGLDDSAWDTPIGVVYVLKLFRGLGTTWKPLGLGEYKLGLWINNRLLGKREFGVLDGRGSWSWDFMECRYNFRSKTIERPEVSWIFRPDESISQLAIRRYLHTWGLSWTSLTEVTIK